MFSFWFLEPSLRSQFRCQVVNTRYTGTYSVRETRKKESVFLFIYLFIMFFFFFLLSVDVQGPTHSILRVSSVSTLWSREIM